MSPEKAQPGYVGRFAPSPTGDLHFGSLVAAVGSYLQARSKGGKWLIRIEDIDPPREVAGSAHRIIADLGRLGMHPDAPVLFQASRQTVYFEACESLLDNGRAFRCSCSRSMLPASGIYPGTCRGSTAADPDRKTIRVKVGKSRIRFTDKVMGTVHQDLEHEVGDFVIHRADGLPAYQLAVAIDDAFQGITEVVRGADLLESTPRQIFLQKALHLPTPDYLHLPVAVAGEREKLSKRHGSDPVNRSEPAFAIEQALKFLGHAPPGNLGLEALWTWAVEHWHPGLIPRDKTRPARSNTVTR